MVSPYAVIFMGDLEEGILNCSFKPLVWQRYTDDIFLLRQYGEEKLKEFLNILNRYHPLASSLLQSTTGNGSIF